MSLLNKIRKHFKKVPMGQVPPKMAPMQGIYPSSPYPPPQPPKNPNWSVTQEPPPAPADFTIVKEIEVPSGKVYVIEIKHEDVVAYLFSEFKFGEDWYHTKSNGFVWLTKHMQTTTTNSKQSLTKYLSKSTS